MNVRQLAPVIAIATALLAILLPRLLARRSTRLAKVMGAVLRPSLIMAAGFGLAFALRKGAFFGVQGAVFGATLAFGTSWIGALLGFTGDRSGTVLGQSLRGRAHFGVAAGIVTLGALRFLAPRGSHLMERAAVAAIAGGTLLLVVVWIREAWLLQRVLGWARDAKPTDDPGDLRADKTIHLGLGDERWVVAERPGSPYRDGRSGEVMIVGRLIEVVRRLATAVFGRTVAMVIALVALHAALGPRPEPAPHSTPVVTARPVFVETPAPRKPRDTRTWVSWYPQPGPIVEDLDRDGVEDVIGLRWESSRESAALSVIATSGENFENLWRSENIPAQWHNRATSLVRSGETLFFTDSEGKARVLDLRTGKLRATVSTPPPEQLCGAPDGPEQAYVVTSNPSGPDEGVLIDAEGNVTKAKRPSWCRATWEIKRCPLKDGTPCSPLAWPPFLNQVAIYANLLEEGEIGLATAGRKHPQKEAQPGIDVLFGYDPRTRTKRFETAIPFTDDELHQNPRLSHTQRGGRFFAHYQLRSGKWMLGARDGLTGEALWSQTPPRTEHGTHFSSMNATHARLYVALDSRLEVFNALTGASIGVVW